MLITGIVKKIKLPTYHPNTHNPRIMIAVTELIVAVERLIHDKGGEVASVPVPFRVKIYNRLGEVTADYCRKGSEVRLDVNGVYGFNEKRTVVAHEVWLKHPWGGDDWKCLSEVAEDDVAPLQLVAAQG